ncbi:MAG: cell division protein FtsZ [Deltaproteobacteria bacterium]|nr:cell division protein FtsZ [Deltaproteobacteria bacterium]
MSFDPNFITPPGAKIKVIGVGGGGGNAVNTMIRSSLDGVEFITANTDVQALRFSLAEQKLQVGKELTRGLGAGADPDVGRDAALEDRYEIQQALAGADMVFITAGMGGGTGTGGAAVVAQIARELGALTVAVVTKPFTFEGKRRRKHADLGIARLRECVDTLITIPNQRLLQVASPSLSMIDAFKMADEVLVNAVRGISDIINIPGRVNVDFADVKTVMSCMGQALMGIGAATGEGRAAEAARMAISSPLLEDIDIEGATGILINITAGSDVTLMEVNEACSIVENSAHEDANIIFGAVIDESLGGQMRVTVIATGFPVDKEETTGSSSSSVKPQPSFSNRIVTATPTGYDSKSLLTDQSLATAEGVIPPPVVMPPTVPVQAKKEESLIANTSLLPFAMEGEPKSLIQEPTIPSLALDLSGNDEARKLAAWTFDLADEQSPGGDTEDLINPEADIMALLPGEDEHLKTPTNEIEPIAEPILADSHLDSSSADLAPTYMEPSVEALEVPSLDTLQDPEFSAGIFEHGLEALADAAQQLDLRSGGMRSEELALEPEQMEAVAEIDRKIDEALALAERVRSPQQLGDQDNLEVPAFLRQGMRDLPLD